MLKVKLQKSPKYSHFRILLKAAERLGIFSIPVRVTIQRSRKQRKYVVPEFCFLCENAICSLFQKTLVLSRRSHTLRLIFICAKIECCTDCFGDFCLCFFEHKLAYSHDICYLYIAYRSFSDTLLYYSVFCLTKVSIFFIVSRIASFPCLSAWRNSSHRYSA